MTTIRHFSYRIEECAEERTFDVKRNDGALVARFYYDPPVPRASAFERAKHLCAAENAEAIRRYEELVTATGGGSPYARREQ
jgi:hypothetical protein